MVYSFHLSLSAGAGGANKRPRKHLTCTSQETRMETTWETKLTVANTERRQRQSSRLTQAMQRKRQLQGSLPEVQVYQVAYSLSYCLYCTFKGPLLSTVYMCMSKVVLLCVCILTALNSVCVRVWVFGFLTTTADIICGAMSHRALEQVSGSWQQDSSLMVITADSASWREANR